MGGARPDQRRAGPGEGALGAHPRGPIRRTPHPMRFPPWPVSPALGGDDHRTVLLTVDPRAVVARAVVEGPS